MWDLAKFIGSKGGRETSWTALRGKNTIFKNPDVGNSAEQPPGLKKGKEKEKKWRRCSKLNQTEES